MFKVIISDFVYNKIINTEEQKTEATRSYLYKLLKQQQMQCLTAEQTTHLKTHPEDVLKNPSSLYILDVTKAEALSIQRNYGVMCLNGESPDISPLIDINDEHTTEEMRQLGRGWDTVLDSVEHLPSNGLILTDRYLFKTVKAVYGNGFDNVRSILTELLPRELNTNYHVTVIFDKNHIDDSYTFNCIAKQLNELKEEFGRSYPITMEVLGITERSGLYFSLHNRRIVSNYYVVKMDYKLAAFNKAIGTAEQTITPQVLFTEDSLNHHSTPPLNSMLQITTALRKFSQSLSLKTTDHSTYCYAFDGKRMEKCIAIRNRLIK